MFCGGASVFGVSWCSFGGGVVGGGCWCGWGLLVWAGVRVGVLLGFGLGSGYVRSVVSGGVVSLRGGVVSSGLLFSLRSPVGGGSASLRSPVGGGRGWCGVWCACA